jgi:NTP pyrophosphatase (non-canonical NTP hydrolase)
MNTSRDSLRTLAEGFGLRLNHHNVGNLIDACRKYHRDEEADYLEKVLARSSEVTRSCFIGPFIDMNPVVHEITRDVDRVGMPDGSVYCGAAGMTREELQSQADALDFEYANLPPENGHVYEGPVRLDFHELQLQQFAWVNHNFPDQLEDPLRQDDSFIGMVEELGEIARSILKLRQGIRGTEEKWLRERKDGVGDLVIFLCSFCNSYGLSLQECVETTWAEVRERDWKKYPTTGRPALG